MFFARFRTEDGIALLTALGLVAFAGIRSALAGMILDEGSFWDFNYIIAPVAILIFAHSLRYAIGGKSVSSEETFGRIGRVLRDWSPFLFFLMIYTAFYSTILQHTSRQDYDVQLLALDRRWFGETPALVMQSWINPFLTNLLSLAYFLHLVLPPVLAVAWYVRDREQFREFLLAILLCGALGCVGYIMIPAVGPGPAFPHLFSRSISGGLSEFLLGALDTARVTRDVFPSLHIAISTVVIVFAYRRGPWWFWTMLPFVIGNWVSTLYLRYHYLVDDLAGWALAVVVLFLARGLLKAEARLRRRLEQQHPSQEPLETNQKSPL